MAIIDLYINIYALMLEAVSTSETSENFYQTTQRNIPEDSHLHACRRENPKSHQNTYLMSFSLNYLASSAQLLALYSVE
jgi:hypothetical protein